MELERGIAWAAERLGSSVVAADPLAGGVTSTMLRLSCADGQEAVLRLMTNEPWRTHGRELTLREHETQLYLAPTGVPAPGTMALDADGALAGHPAHLMTLLPGGVDLERCSAADLTTVVRLLVDIHSLQPGTPPRPYQSWAVPAKHVVPPWARDPQVWERAFAVLTEAGPPFDGVFLHRDFAPRNLLWTGPDITGVVDWVETSWGPAWLDVAHFRTMLAVTHGTPVADRFGEIYQSLTGRTPQPYFDVMDIVGLLPGPGRQPFVTDPDQQVRLEDHLRSVL